MALYPARTYFRVDTMRFRKHYFSVPGDLAWKNAGGALTEEFLCAQAIDLLDDVDTWVRNFVHPSQFRMPAAKQRTYPDFVVRLTDGRLLMVEYKCGDRFTSDQEKEKRLVGALWAKGSGGRGLCLMAQRVDEKGRNFREQLLAAVRLG